MKNNDVSVTKVTITYKDCAEISALEQHFSDAKHILCQFHVLKAVDSHLKKTKNSQCVNNSTTLEMLKKFRHTMYAGTKAVFDDNKAYLTDKGNQTFKIKLVLYFTIIYLWVTEPLHLILRTIGLISRRSGLILAVMICVSWGTMRPIAWNGSQEKLLLKHLNVKLQLCLTTKVSITLLRRCSRSRDRIKGLIDIVLIRLSDRQLKQSIQDLRFAVQEKHPAVSKFAGSISPFAWNLLNGEMKIMKKTFDFVLDQVSHLQL